MISGEAFQCYRCIAGEDCFKSGDIGVAVNCTAPQNTGCYTIAYGKVIWKCSSLIYLLKSSELQWNSIPT